MRSVHAPDELLPAAYELAREIADNTSPVSVALTRQMMWRGLGADDPMEAHKVDSPAIAARGASADAMEGVMSFLEKRPAVFPLKVSSDMPDLYPWWDGAHASTDGGGRCPRRRVTYRHRSPSSGAHMLRRCTDALGDAPRRPLP